MEILGQSVRVVRAVLEDAINRYEGNDNSNISRGDRPGESRLHATLSEVLPRGCGGLYSRVANITFEAAEAVSSLKTIILVHLGDGITRVNAGKSLNLNDADVDFARNWNKRGAYGLCDTDDQRPAHPPELAPDNIWSFCGHVDGTVVERREIDGTVGGFENNVVVFREGVALPTRELLGIVNNAHAVLVLRGTKEYSYLRDDFVLSTREEEALTEWGVGRPLLANSLLAVGGTLTVAFAEQIWGPAVVGTLVVAAAAYRVQGALTKVLRVGSAEWEQNKLVPSRIHGSERAVQLTLVTLVALADLLDHRVLLLASLICASAQVVLLEYVGQAVLTWSYAEYNRVLLAQAWAWTQTCVMGVFSVWFGYVFAGFFGCYLSGDLLTSLVLLKDAPFWFKASAVSVIMLGSVGVGIWAAVLDWNEADLKFSTKSLQPWRWPVLTSPDSFSTSARIVGLWFLVVTWVNTVLLVAVGVLSFRISSDGGMVVGMGKRTRDRESYEVFSHYHDTSIPSRNLLVPCGEEQTREVGQQPQSAPVASVV